MKKIKFFAAFWVCGSSLVALSSAQAQTGNPQPVLGDHISRAIAEITGRAARPEENDPARYGFSYDEIKNRVARVYLPCDDVQIAQAILEVTGRPARGLENQGECHSALYGQGRWENYADLKTKVRQTLVASPFETGVCRLDELTKAITEVKKARGLGNVKPSGAGELGECNSYLYGDGVWHSETDLKAKVAARLTALQASGLRLSADNSVSPIASRGKNSAKWFAVAGAVFTALGQWKADEAPPQQPLPMQQPMQGMPGQMPMQQQPMQPQMPMQQQPMQSAPAPVGALQPNMISPEMMQQLLLMLQAQQAQQQQGAAPQPMPAQPMMPAPEQPQPEFAPVP